MPEEQLTSAPKTSCRLDKWRAGRLYEVILRAEDGTVHVVRPGMSEWAILHASAVPPKEGA